VKAFWCEFSTLLVNEKLKASGRTTPRAEILMSEKEWHQHFDMFKQM